MSSHEMRRRSAFSGRIVIVGASLAGLCAAETLRGEGFGGPLTVIGDEPYLPYDRPPLSKAVVTGWIAPEHTQLPRRATRSNDVEWRLGVPASSLNLSEKQVVLADGRSIDYDRLLIATGTRARPWFNVEEANLDGVLTLRGRDDARELRAHLASKPKRVLIIGGGFTGSEIASSCRELGLAVTLVERGKAPLVGALGGTIAERAARLQRVHGVDLRCGVSVSSLEDQQGRLRRAHFSDGSTLETEVAIVALGAIRNVEWLGDSGLAAGPLGVACDAGCRAFDINGIVSDDVFVAGDIARFPNPLYNYQLMALEHWGNAVEQANVAAHNMICEPTARRPHVAVPSFWSSQFGVNIKSVGVPSVADEVYISQGSLDDGSFVASYGKGGQLVAAVAFDGAKWVEFYKRLIEQAAPFPPKLTGVDQPTSTAAVMPAGFPPARERTHQPTVVLTGYDPSEVDESSQYFSPRRVRWIERHNASAARRAGTSVPV